MPRKALVGVGAVLLPCGVLLMLALGAPGCMQTMPSECRAYARRLANLASAAPSLCLLVAVAQVSLRARGGLRLVPWCISVAVAAVYALEWNGARTHGCYAEVQPQCQLLLNTLAIGFLLSVVTAVLVTALAVKAMATGCRSARRGQEVDVHGLTDNDESIASGPI